MAKFLDENGLLYLWSKIKAAINSMTYADASTSTSGLMSANDKTKLDNVQSNANHYVLPNASSEGLGGVKIGENITLTEGNKINVPEATAMVKGVMTISDSVNSEDHTAAASSYAVTRAYQLASSKQSPQETLSGYGITDAYTKTEVDNKLTSAVVYKGYVNNYSDLGFIGNKTGDMYNIVNADIANSIKAGDNAVWNGSSWDIQSGTVDLSGCVQNTDKITNAEIDVIVAS